MECSIPNDRTLNGGPLVVSLRRNVTVSMAPFDADAESYLLRDNHTNVEFVILGWLSVAGIKNKNRIWKVGMTGAGGIWRAPDRLSRGRMERQGA
jgi:hypothetical protein